jgi:hypothetical protein
MRYLEMKLRSVIKISLIALTALLLVAGAPARPALGEKTNK